MSEEDVFLPGGTLFGFVGDAFIFRSWADVWKAVTTEGHLLADHAGLIMSARRHIRPSALERIRISFDVHPLFIEVVYPRRIGWGIAIAFGLAFLAGVLFATVR